jgi:hypothetical protein
MISRHLLSEIYLNTNNILKKFLLSRFKCKFDMYRKMRYEMSKSGHDVI